MALLQNFTGWLTKRKEWKDKKAFHDKVIEARSEHARWQAHFDKLKFDAEPIRGYIADIKYVNIDEMSKNRHVEGVVDMVFWIRFAFENGVEETIQYFQKPGPDHADYDEQRRMLEFSGKPSILEYGAIGSYVLGYFKDGKLVALENLPPRTPSFKPDDLGPVYRPQPA